MQELQIYKSATGEKVSLKTLQPGIVKIYVCGMTVYDYCHVGHARVMVFFDVLVRVLRNFGYTVNYVRNITDIDDKIIEKANKEGVSFLEITEKFIKAMHEDEKNLGNLSPDYEPKASENIDNMLELIGILIKKGHAYVKSDGSVWFATRSYENYGKVSGQCLDALRSGVRKDGDANKEDDLDFVLWKPSKPGEPSWESPWGDGRPGWHIECSAMASSYLGFTIDIHGGGVDLKFPHHENESAQSCCAFEADYVRNWMHVGHVTNNDEKMSKSLGNFLTIRDALKQASGEAIRYMLLSSHYRKPLPFNSQNLKQAERCLSRFYRVLKSFPPSIEASGSKHFNNCIDSLKDDFNLVQLFANCFELVKEIYRSEDFEYACSLSADLQNILRLLGFANEAPEKYLQQQVSISESEIKSAIAKREDARSKHNWALADQIRDDLLVDGVVLEDSPNGTTWRTC